MGHKSWLCYQYKYSASPSISNYEVPNLCFHSCLFIWKEIERGVRISRPDQVRYFRFESVKVRNPVRCESVLWWLSGSPRDHIFEKEGTFPVQTVQCVDFCRVRSHFRCWLSVSVNVGPQTSDRSSDCRRRACGRGSWVSRRGSWLRSRVTLNRCGGWAGRTAGASALGE